MRAIGVRRAEHDFAIARQLEIARDIRSVDERDSPDLSLFAGDDDDLRVRLDRAVAPREGHAVGRERGAVRGRRRAHGLMCHRPHCTRGEILDVNPVAGVVLSRVGAPAEHVQPIRSAMTAPRVREQHAVAGAAQQRDVRLRRVRRIDLVHLEVRSRRWLDGDRLGRIRLRRPRHIASRHTLVEQQRRGANGGVGHETTLPNSLCLCVTDAQRVGQRDEAHPNVMRHEGSHDRNVFVIRDARIIERVVESEFAQGAELF